MLWLLPIFILSAPGDAAIEHRYAETIFATDFEQGVDQNFDSWPDNWTRRRGRGYPQYLKVGIVHDPQASGDRTRCLRIDLDGGGAAVYSPPIAVSSLFSYVFAGRIRTEQLVHDEAFFTITFLRADRQKKETYTSARFRDVSSWQQVRLGPLTPKDPQARLAVIGLHLVPTDRSDLRGAALFDDIRLARLPFMSVRTGRQHNIFYDPNDVEVSCQVSGIQQPDPDLIFELLSVDGRVLASKSLTLDGRQIADPRQNVGVNLAQDTGQLSRGGYAGELKWRPEVGDYGFYRVRVSMRGTGEHRLQRSVTLSVMRNSETPLSGEFGWSLPSDKLPLSAKELVGLLGQVGISWVKCPAWYDPRDTAAADRVGWLADRLSAQGIDVVGMFDKPPKQVREQFGNKKQLTVAEVFLEPEVWHAAVDPIMVRLSLKIRWWQLGADEDDSFIEFPELEAKIREIRTHLKQFGQRTRLGMAWRWMHELPSSQHPPWDFLALTEDPAFTSAELTRYVNESAGFQMRRWVTLWPLPQGEFDERTRARDLALRMVSAKVNQVQVVFLGNPFDGQRGVMTADGSPGALFLPWCTTARTISGARYLGSLQLPQGSHNHVFERDGEAVMVVWNDRPVTESLYLGDSVRQVDLWGREVVRPSVDSPRGPQQRLEVSRLPTFVTGLSLPVALWRLNFKFDPDRLQSVFGKPQAAHFQFRNTFPEGVGGTIQMHVPDVWDLRGGFSHIRMATDEERKQRFDVMFHTDASSGPQRVRVDFDITANRRYQFSVYRDVRVGLGDIVIELNTWLDDRGRLVVEQHLINRTKEHPSFNCLLFAPHRRRLRQQVFDLGPGRTTRTYALSNGRELLGKSLWLRVEELGGDRLLNDHVVAEP